MRVARVRICYCLAAMKRAGSQICELEPLSCVPARHTGARQSGVDGGRSIIWQQNPDPSMGGEGKAHPPLPDLETGWSFQRRQITLFNSIKTFGGFGNCKRKPKLFSSILSTSAFRKYLCTCSAELLPVPPMHQALSGLWAFLWTMLSPCSPSSLRIHAHRLQVGSRLSSLIKLS